MHSSKVYLKLFTFKKLLTLLGFFIILVSIPGGAIFIRNQTLGKSNPNLEVNSSMDEAKPNSALDELKKLVDGISSPFTSSPSANEQLNLGRTMNLKINIEGRSINSQQAKVFIGLARGEVTSKPTYLLTYTVDFPSSGEFSNLSLTGLDLNTTYTAYIKGPSQIDSAQSFMITSSQEVKLNNGSPILLITGDLNQDNLINDEDYPIIKKLLGTTSKSKNWNERADFNLDGVINVIDLGIVSKNLNKTGASGVWFLTPTGFSDLPISSPSAVLNASTQEASPSGGYWIYIPPLTFDN